MQKTLSFYAGLLAKDYDSFCNEKLSHSKLTVGLLPFVLFIGDKPGCTPGSISGSLHFDSGYTTRCIDKLVSLGFVSRKKRTNDKRAYALTLTKKGTTLYDEKKNYYKEWDKKTLAPLTKEEQKSLLALCKKVLSGSDMFKDLV